MREPLTGGCLCGDVRFEITGTPVASAICHCVSCRRAAGAESVAWAVCSVADFKFTATMPSVYKSSENVQRTFCSRCGSSLTYQVKTDFIDVTLATLDNPELINPTKEVWTESRVSWNALHGDLAVHERGV